MAYSAWSEVCRVVQVKKVVRGDEAGLEVYHCFILEECSLT